MQEWRSDVEPRCAAPCLHGACIVLMTEFKFLGQAGKLGAVTLRDNAYTTQKSLECLNWQGLKIHANDTFS